MGNKSLKFKEILAYSGVAFAMAIMMDPMPAIMFQFYVQHTEVSLAAVGTVLFFSRIIDAVTDPAIGYFSDNTRTKMGSRKPWLIVGGIVSVIGVYFFYNPSPDSGIVYFAVFCNLYYLCRTLLSIPHAAWGSEITRDYHERARIGAWFGGLLLSAQLIFLALPVLISSPLLPIFESAELLPEMVSLIGWVGISFIPLSILFAIWVAPVGDSKNKGSSASNASIIDNIRATAHNKPFWLFLWAKSFGIIGGLIFFSVAIIAISSYLHLGEQVPLILLTLTLTQIISIYFWRLATGKFGKHQAIIAGWYLQALLLPLMFFIEPGESAFYPFLIIASLTSIAQTPSIVFSSAVLSDVVDYDILKTGVNRAGNYFALDAFILKSIGAFAGSIGFLLLAYYGFDPKITDNTEEAEFGLLITLCVIPSIFMFLAATILCFFPINERRHNIIRRKLELRSKRQASA